MGHRASGGTRKVSDHRENVWCWIWIERICIHRRSLGNLHHLVIDLNVVGLAINTGRVSGGPVNVVSRIQMVVGRTHRLRQRREQVAVFQTLDRRNSPAGVGP